MFLLTYLLIANVQRIILR